MDKTEELFKEVMNARFLSMLGKGLQVKKRTCLRCQKQFRSLNAGHRICATCRRVTDKMASNNIYTLGSA
jgi:hypothetical protein